MTQDKSFLLVSLPYMGFFPFHNWLALYCSILAKQQHFLHLPPGLVWQPVNLRSSAVIEDCLLNPA